jgi:hypothetical protein
MPRAARVCRSNATDLALTLAALANGTPDGYVAFVIVAADRKPAANDQESAIGLDWRFAGVAPIHAPGASDLRR